MTDRLETRATASSMVLGAPHLTTLRRLAAPPDRLGAFRPLSGPRHRRGLHAVRQPLRRFTSDFQRRRRLGEDKQCLGATVDVLAGVFSVVVRLAVGGVHRARDGLAVGLLRCDVKC